MFPALEDFADSAQKRATAEGLGEETHRGIGVGHFRGGVFAVARHEDDAKPRIFPLQLNGKFLARHAGHDHVRDKKIDGAAVLAGQLDGFGGVLGFDDFVATRLEKFLGDFADVLLIFGEENRFRARGNFRRWAWTPRSALRLDRRGEDRF